jgi:hypothetical protein
MPALSQINLIRRLHGDEAAAREILRAIVSAKGSKTQAAGLLGIGRSAFFRLVSEMKLDEQIAKLSTEHGFRKRAGRARGEVDEEVLEAIREGRRKAEQKAG